MEFYHEIRIKTESNTAVFIFKFPSFGKKKGTFFLCRHAIPIQYPREDVRGFKRGNTRQVFFSEMEIGGIFVHFAI